MNHSLDQWISTETYGDRLKLLGELAQDYGIDVEMADEDTGLRALGAPLLFSSTAYPLLASAFQDLQSVLACRCEDFSVARHLKILEPEALADLVKGRLDIAGKSLKKCIEENEITLEQQQAVLEALILVTPEVAPHLMGKQALEAAREEAKLRFPSSQPQHR